MFAKVADGFREAGFAGAEQWRFDWERTTPATSGWISYPRPAGARQSRFPQFNGAFQVESGTVFGGQPP